MKKILLALTAVLFSWPQAFAIETAAKQAYMVDMTTHSVLYNKSGDEQMHPSSMSKLMTIYILFSRLKEGRVHLEDKFHISEKAWRTQGSKSFVPLGEEISVEELIHGIIIQSGNDACVVVAEGLAGTEDAFVVEMNRVAKEIGLEHSHFSNATGLPAVDHLMTAHDLAILAEYLITDFPEYYHYFSQREYTYNHITQQNRNRLLGSGIGVDGLKTGHTEEAGFGITLSAKQGDRRIITVLNGMKDDNERFEEGDKMIRWGFREFINKSLLAKGQQVANAEVWFGKADSVPLVAAEDVMLTLPASGGPPLSFTLKYNGPVPAPIAKGAHVADLVIKSEGHELRTIPLAAGEDVPKLSGISKLMALFNYHVLHRGQ